MNYFGSRDLMGILFSMFGVVLLLIMIVPFVLYLTTLQKALSRCVVESRTLAPGLVWLMLIPVFNVIWNFLVVGHISKSLHNEFTRRGTPGIEPEPGKTLGLAMCILACCAIIPPVGPLAWVAGLICWIAYWTKIAGYARLLRPGTMVAGAY